MTDRPWEHGVKLWNRWLDNSLERGLQQLDNLRPALESTHRPGSRAWVVERVLVNLVTGVIMAGLVTGVAWVWHRWTTWGTSSLWAGFVGAMLVMSALEVRSMRRAVRDPMTVRR